MNDRHFLALVVIATCGVNFFLGLHPSGNWSWILMLAPIPILLVSFRTSSALAFLIASLSYLIGAMGAFQIATDLSSLLNGVIAAIINSICYGAIIVLNGRIVLRLNSALFVLSYSVLITAWEYLNVNLFAGTMSVPYAQVKNSMIDEIVSLIGRYGAIFFLTLVPSAVATVICFSSSIKKLALTILSQTIFIRK